MKQTNTHGFRILLFRKAPTPAHDDRQPGKRESLAYATDLPRPDALCGTGIFCKYVSRPLITTSYFPPPP